MGSATLNLCRYRSLIPKNTDLSRRPGRESTLRHHQTFNPHPPLHFASSTAETGGKRVAKQLLEGCRQWSMAGFRSLNFTPAALAFTHSHTQKLQLGFSLPAKAEHFPAGRFQFAIPCCSCLQQQCHTGPSCRRFLCSNTFLFFVL